MKSIQLKKIVAVLGLSFAALSAQADDRFTLNGYGYQDMGKTSANVTNGTDAQGTVATSLFALVVSAKVTSKDTFWAQLETSGSDNTRFTWAFLDHFVNDNLTVRAGRVKFPYGIINEFIDNHAMQVGISLPLAYNSGADMSYDAYTGAGADWSVGSVFAQVYGGNIYIPPPTSYVTTSFTNATNLPSITDRSLIGTRLTWNTPLDGLRVFVSANQTQTQAVVTASPSAPATFGAISRENRAMLSADYTSDSLDLRAEYNYHSQFAGTNLADFVTSAWYTQASYKLDKFTPFVRYDAFVADSKADTANPNFYQKQVTVGSNYKLSSGVNLRVEDSIIHGYALPVYAGEVALDQGQQDWNLMQAEVNFMF